MNLSSAVSGQLMAVKTLKINFLKLVNHKLIFVNCKFVSVKTGLNSFIPLQHKLISLAALSNNCWIYVFNATSFQIFLKIFCTFRFIGSF